MTKTEFSGVKLKSNAAMEIDGVHVPAGLYPATRKRLGTPYEGQTRWEELNYLIIVDGDTLDATPHVNSGEFIVII